MKNINTSAFQAGDGSLVFRSANRFRLDGFLPLTWVWLSGLLAALAVGTAPFASHAAETPDLEVGLAMRDITPSGPIWLAGYAGRKRPSEKVDHPLVVQACAIKSSSGERFVLVSLDNCEVSHAFIEPVLQEVEKRFGLERGRAMVVSSHTHSAPVLENTLISMYPMTDVDHEAVRKYSEVLHRKLVEVIGAALEDLKPALLEHSVGRATFAMNRRVYRETSIDFGENPDGPVDWDVPVLRIKGTNDAVRAILFGYACHGTSISGEEFYYVSGDYMAYARQHLETHYPGAMAIYLTGMGADSNPSPRGRLIDAKRHGLELAGAVTSVLERPMRPVRGSLKIAYTEVELPFEDPPNRERLEADLKSQDIHVQKRAASYQEMMTQGKPLPTGLKLPLAAVRLGDDLTFVAMGGEVVVDYATRFKRIFANDYPWLIGYAYEVPCYIPSMRIIKEGGYEAQSSLIYYGYYGPFRGRVEDILVNKMVELVGSVKGR